MSIRTSAVRVRASLGEAAREVRSAWSRRTWAVLTLVGAAALLPLALLDPVRLSALSAALAVALAVVGLNVAVGFGGMASLGQGAFMAIGAFGVALLRARAGWDPVTATATATAAAVVGGALVGAGAARLRGPFVAVATWVVAWLTAFGLLAFPVLSGGARGVVMPPVEVPLPGAAVRLTEAAQYAVVLTVLVLSVLATWALRRGAPGLALAAVRQGPDAAESLGIRAGRQRLVAFTVAAGMGGLAGALLVQVVGVADASAFGPLRSVELFVAVLVGGAGTVLGPLVGAGVLAGMRPAAEGIGAVAGVAPERFEAVIASVLLLAVLLAGRGGVVTWLARRRSGSPPAEPGSPFAVAEGVPLEAIGIRQRFGGVVALDGLSLTVHPGQIHALVGPNGSGKTTLLRILAGATTPDAGTVHLGGRDPGTAVADRVAAGVVRTLQPTSVFPDLTVLEHVEAGATFERRYGGWLRTVAATPLARAEAARVRARAAGILAVCGLAGRAGDPVGALGGGERRLLMLATALAARPRVLLLDEPAAGMSAPETERLAAVLRTLREGLAILLVDHDFHLIRAVADRVTVLEAGRVIAEGTPGEVADAPAVVEAYLGDAGVNGRSG